MGCPVERDQDFFGAHVERLAPRPSGAPLRTAEAVRTGRGTDRAAAVPRSSSRSRRRCIPHADASRSEGSCPGCRRSCGRPVYGGNHSTRASPSGLARAVMAAARGQGILGAESWNAHLPISFSVRIPRPAVVRHHIFRTSRTTCSHTVAFGGSMSSPSGSTTVFRPPESNRNGRPSRNCRRPSPTATWETPLRCFRCSVRGGGRSRGTRLARGKALIPR